jgi:hypothetical protein
LGGSSFVTRFVAAFLTGIFADARVFTGLAPSFAAAVPVARFASPRGAVPGFFFEGNGLAREQQGGHQYRNGREARIAGRADRRRRTRTPGTASPLRAGV